MAEPLPFSLKAEDSETAARQGELALTRGTVRTPFFMPVGTHGAVKTQSPGELSLLGAQVVLSNTYHLYLRPGTELLEQVGGLHPFMGWDGPILTDSGGYQIYSLAALRDIDDEGVSFQSHLDGSSHRFTPEKVVDYQRAIGSDFVTPLDECPPGDASKDVWERRWSVPAGGWSAAVHNSTPQRLDMDTPNTCSASCRGERIKP